MNLSRALPFRLSPQILALGIRFTVRFGGDMKIVTGPSPRCHSMVPMAESLDFCETLFFLLYGVDNCDTYSEGCRVNVHDLCEFLSMKLGTQTLLFLLYSVDN